MRVQELHEELQAAKESTRAARGRENALKEEVDGLNQDLQRSQKTQRRLQTEKEEREQQVLELKQQIKRLSSALQVGVWKESMLTAVTNASPRSAGPLLKSVFVDLLIRINQRGGARPSRTCRRRSRGSSQTWRKDPRRKT